jgi:putative transposase
LAMPRAARIVIPGLPHHVLQRGEGGREVFRSDADRSVYLELLQQQGRRLGVVVLGYCLMNDHVHLVVRPKTATALAQAIGRTHWLYSQHVRQQSGRRQSLWQSRFYSCALDDAHLADALVYIERSPVRARLSRYPWAYRWSSAPAHSNGADPGGLLDMDAWRRVSSPAQWRSLLVRPEDEAAAAKLRLSLSTGRPLATDSTLTRLEQRLGRRLRALPIGRPKGKTTPAKSKRSRK